MVDIKDLDSKNAKKRCIFAAGLSILLFIGLLVNYGVITAVNHKGKLSAAYNNVFSFRTILPGDSGGSLVFATRGLSAMHM